MSTKTIPAHILKAYLEQTPPDEEINLSELDKKLQNKSTEDALAFFSTLPEYKKVMYLFYLYNYYYNILREESQHDDWLLELTCDNIYLQEIENDFIIPFNLNTTELVPLRKLISALQKLTALQKQYAKRKVEDI